MTTPSPTPTPNAAPTPGSQPQHPAVAASDVQSAVWADPSLPTHQAPPAPASTLRAQDIPGFDLLPKAAQDQLLAQLAQVAAAPPAPANSPVPAQTWDAAQEEEDEELPDVEEEDDELPDLEEDEEDEDEGEELEDEGGPAFLDDPVASAASEAALVALEASEAAANDLYKANTAKLAEEATKVAGRDPVAPLILDESTIELIQRASQVRDDNAIVRIVDQVATAVDRLTVAMMRYDQSDEERELRRQIDEARERLAALRAERKSKGTSKKAEAQVEAAAAAAPLSATLPNRRLRSGAKLVPGQLASVTEIASQVAPAAPAAPAPQPAAEKPASEMSKIRQWARERGMQVADRGRIEKAIKDLYYASNPSN